MLPSLRLGSSDISSLFISSDSCDLIPIHESRRVSLGSKKQVPKLSNAFYGKTETKESRWT